MKHPQRHTIIAIILLLNSLNSYSFDFFGANVDGTLDEVTEKLESIGFAPVMAIPKTGEYAGQKVVFGNDSLRVLSGTMLGYPINLDISTGNKSSVNLVTIKYQKSDTNTQNEFSGELFKYLCDKYQKPESIIVKKYLSGDELSKFQSIFDGDAPDIQCVWKLKDVIIMYHNYFSTGIVECVFSKNEHL